MTAKEVETPAKPTEDKPQATSVKRGRPKKEKVDDMLPLTLGLALQQARHAKHMKLPSISKKLCIREEYLAALENGKYDIFPALAYGIGFLRTYAAFLELNPNEMVERFRKETGDIREEPLDLPRNHDASILPSRRTVIRSLIALFLLYFLWNLYQALTLKPFPEIVLPAIPKKQEVIPVSEAQSPVIEQQLKIVKSVEDQKKSEKVPLPPEKPKKIAQRTPLTYGLKQVARVSFVATEQTTIEIQDTEDNSVLLKKTLEVGDRYNPDPDPDGLVLKTTNAGGLDIYVDGKKIRTLGKKGQTKTSVQMDAKSLLKD